MSKTDLFKITLDVALTLTLTERKRIYATLEYGMWRKSSDPEDTKECRTLIGRPLSGTSPEYLGIKITIVEWKNFENCDRYTLSSIHPSLRTPLSLVSVLTVKKFTTLELSTLMFINIILDILNRNISLLTPPKSNDLKGIVWSDGVPDYTIDDFRNFQTTVQLGDGSVVDIDCKLVYHDRLVAINIFKVGADDLFIVNVGTLPPAVNNGINTLVEMAKRIAAWIHSICAHPSDAFRSFLLPPGGASGVSAGTGTGGTSFFKLRW